MGGTGAGRLRGAILVTIALCQVLGAHAARAAADRQQLGRAGYLIIEAAQDTTAGFTWRAGPDVGRRSLVWAQGRLNVPDTLSLEPFSHRDLGFACRAELAGTGAGGALVFRDGIYPVSEPLRLSDGVFELHLSGGEIEIRGAQLRYRARPSSAGSDPRAPYLLLAGLVILIVVLLRRARRRGPPRSLS